VTWLELLALGAVDEEIKKVKYVSILKTLFYLNEHEYINELTS
jgi:hypothetical protein